MVANISDVSTPDGSEDCVAVQTKEDNIWFQMATCEKAESWVHLIKSVIETSATPTSPLSGTGRGPQIPPPIKKTNQAASEV